MGDFEYKLPSVYTNRVFALATPPLHENDPHRNPEFISNVLTPPYVSSIPEVRHFNLNSITAQGPVTLIMSSDGLPDLYERSHGSMSFVEAVRSWHDREMKLVERKFANLSQSLLWHALRGDVDPSLLKPRGRVDDTSIIVLPLVDAEFRRVSHYCYR